MEVLLPSLPAPGYPDRTRSTPSASRYDASIELKGPPAMHSMTVTVGSAVGLHARPAAIISEAAGALDSTVLIAMPGGNGVDASSSLLIMTLGAGNGAVVEVSGADEAAVERIADLVSQDLDA